MFGIQAFLAVKVNVDVATLRPFCHFLEGGPPWATKKSTLYGHCAESIRFLMVKIDVDVATLRPFAHFLLGGPPWATKNNTLRGHCAESMRFYVSKRM